MRFFVLHVAVTVLLLDATFAANPVTTPIIKGELNVYTRRFAKVPDRNGGPAQITCIIPYGLDLYVCTANAVYKVSRQGTVSLFINVEDAIASQTDRFLNTFNKMHGGVRSIAFHPSYRTTGLFYISAMESRPKDPPNFKYVSDSSNPINADSVLLEFKYDRFRRSVDLSSYRNVFRVGMPVFDHPIKQMAFYGSYLYIAHGDGSVQSATAGGGQNNDALGKILRIDPLQRGSQPYTVPSSNPFVGSSSFPDEVYAYGFRNPHHICFGRDGTLYAAETGRDNVEEINLVASGGNYGWSEREGTFVHLNGGGLINGVTELPADDAKFGYIYPAAQVGHEGNVGAGFVGQAIAGGCPVENGSPMSGNYYYADFPRSGNLYYSGISELRQAKTTGTPSSLTQARTRQAKIFFEKNGVVSEFDSLGDVVRFDEGLSGGSRADIRFGRNAYGDLLWSSKANGRLYIFTSSQRGGPGGPV
ncbi:unnamed protein product [Agarophyton chilense]